MGGLLVTLALIGCGGLELLPYGRDTSAHGFESYEAVQAAYRAVTPGVTLASDLDGLGFDPARSSNVKVLSYLGVLERLMPQDSVRFDGLAPAVQSCMDAPARCTAYVFRPHGIEGARGPTDLWGATGFGHRRQNVKWSAQVLLLMLDGRVAYKAMSGRPSTGV